MPLVAAVSQDRFFERRACRATSSGGSNCTTAWWPICRSTPRAVDEALAAAGISPQARPQTLDVAAWLRLTEALYPGGHDLTVTAAKDCGPESWRFGVPRALWYTAVSVAHT